MKGIYVKGALVRKPLANPIDQITKRIRDLEWAISQYAIAGDADEAQRHSVMRDKLIGERHDLIMRKMGR